MFYRLIKAVHDLYRDNGIQIFGSPVFFRRPDNLVTDCHDSLVSSDLHSLFQQCLYDSRKMGLYNIFMYDQRLACIAGSKPLSFCIDHDIDSHLGICILIDISMAVSGSCLDHGNRAVFHDTPDQSGSASWNEDINIFIHLHHLCGSFPAGIFQELNAEYRHLFLG